MYSFVQTHNGEKNAKHNNNNNMYTGTYWYEHKTNLQSDAIWKYRQSHSLSKWSRLPTTNQNGEVTNSTSISFSTNNQHNKLWWTAQPLKTGPKKLTFTNCLHVLANYMHTCSLPSMHEVHPLEFQVNENQPIPVSLLSLPQLCIHIKEQYPEIRAKRKRIIYPEFYDITMITSTHT